MNINELRINNLISHNGLICTVEIINSELNEIYFLGEDFYHSDKPENLEGVPLTEEVLLKFGFENWGYGSLYSNEHEKYTRYVLHNILDGTSNFEIHFIESNYGNILHNEYVISCDEDDRINWGAELKHAHQLQNVFFDFINEELAYGDAIQ